MASAAVTGCAGFIGSHLTERLLADNWSVKGVDFYAPTYDSMRRRNLMADLASQGDLEFIEGDLTEIDVDSFIEEADIVFHMAARPGVRASWSDFRQACDTNILALQRLLAAIARKPTTRLVFASSSSVYGQAATYPTKESTTLAPISPYGVTKACGEDLIGAYTVQTGLHAASLRYFTVYGPRQRSDMAFNRWIRRALRSEPLPVYGDGTTVRDFTYVDDVVTATMGVADIEFDGHEVFNVAGGSPATLNEVLDMIGTMVGGELDISYKNRERGDPFRTGGDTTKIEETIGWKPAWTLEEGIASQVAWMRKHYGGNQSGQA